MEFKFVSNPDEDPELKRCLPISIKDFLSQQDRDLSESEYELGKSVTLEPFSKLPEDTSKGN